MGRQTVDQSQLFYLFNLEEQIPADLPTPAQSNRLIQMPIVGYCYDIRFERKLCEEVKLHLGYRWFCRLELDIRLNQRMSTHACSPPFQLADSYD